MTGRPFAKGQSGNPSGRPKGARNRATILRERLLNGDGEFIIDKIIEDAKAGDRVARRFLGARLIPTARERPVPIDLPELRTAADAKAAYDVIRHALSTGELTPADGCQLRSFLDGFLNAHKAEKKERPINLNRAIEETFGIRSRSDGDEI